MTPHARMNLAYSLSACLPDHSLAPTLFIFPSPAQGKVTVYEQRAKLLYELDRANNKAAQHGA